MDEKKTIVRLALAQLSRRDRLEILQEYTAPDTVRASDQAGTEVWPRLKVAEQFNRSLRFVDLLARQGLLRRKVLPGRKRAIGFLASDVRKLLACDGAAALSVASADKSTQAAQRSADVPAVASVAGGPAVDTVTDVADAKATPSEELTPETTTQAVADIQNASAALRVEDVPAGGGEE